MALSRFLVSPTLALDPFTLQETVQQARKAISDAQVRSTNLNRQDYLGVIEGIVHFSQPFQTNDGRIIDPYNHGERQYSTPCYAWAATALIISGRDTNLLSSAALALDSSLRQLAEGKCADNHGDFFTFPAMLAYEHLRDRVPAERRERWETWLAAINPDKAYRGHKGRQGDLHNWNVVALSGEFLRHQDGFTSMDFVETWLGRQMEKFTASGLYRDPNVPMAYDHFPRHFLAAILQRGYSGTHAKDLAELMHRAAWASLLMQSPLGELPTGGRSAQHQWNEAQQCVTYEIWAQRERKLGDMVEARAFKHAAHLALSSITNWVRPSGDLWIVKNYFDPALRRGFETYSNHSQYNLLPASMLASAWLFADDSIPEGACPADVGGYVFKLPEFHKVFANAGGHYLEIDAGADPKYNSTGLLRLHRKGQPPLSGLQDNVPAHDLPMALGIAWRAGTNWQSLAGVKREQIKKVTLATTSQNPRTVSFDLRYQLNQSNLRSVTEHYVLTPDALTIRWDLDGKPDQTSIRLPLLTFDGRQTNHVALRGKTAVFTSHSGEMTFELDPASSTWTANSLQTTNRNGTVSVFESTVSNVAARLTVSYR